MVARSISVLLVVAGMAAASTWYVSPSGSDSKDGKTLANAFASPATGVAAASAGDTVLLAGGTYSVSARINLKTSGTAAKPIHLLAEDPYSKRAVLDFTKQGVGSSNQGVYVTGSYWHIKGLDIQYAGDNGMLIYGGAYDTVEWCSFRLNQDAGLQIRAGANHVLVLNCDSYSNYDSATFGGNADGFAPKLDVGDSVVFRGCRSYDNSDDGWDGYLKTAGTSYSDNMTTIIEDSWAFNNGYYHGLASDSLSTANDGEMNGNGFKMGGSPDKDQRHPHILKHCLGFYNKKKQFDQNNNTGTMTLLNCTAYGKGTGANFAVSQDILASGSTITVKNCINLGGGAASILSSATQATNSWSTDFSVSSSDFQGLDTTGVRGPRKADGSLPDVTFAHLKTGSALIDAGTDVGLAYNGSKPDLGAFETSATSVGISALKRSSGLRLLAGVNGHVQVVADLGSVSSVEITVQDVAGRIAHRQSLGTLTGASSFDLDLSGLQAGNYFVKAQASNGAVGASRIVLR